MVRPLHAAAHGQVGAIAGNCCAGAAIHDAITAQRAAEAQLDNAVAAARRKGLSWAKIGAAAGVSAQAAHERWASKSGASHS
jgi:hypothetical protein